MSVIQFETTVDIENNLIRIPEQYIDKIPARVTVSFVDTKKSDLLLPPTMKTKGWKFNREDANER